MIRGDGDLLGLFCCGCDRCGGNGELGYRMPIMSSFNVNTFYKIEDVIDLVKNKKDRDSIYMIYVPENTDDLLPGMNVYVGDVPEFDDDDNEVLPQSVIALGLEMGYMREHFQDVVDLAYKQKPTASSEEIIRCLNHYAEYDDFLDLH